MASVSIRRGTKAQVEATPISDGQLLFETDQESNRIYMDNGTNRIQVGGSNVTWGNIEDKPNNITLMDNAISTNPIDVRYLRADSVDASLSTTSANPIQNQAVANALTNNYVNKNSIDNALSSTSTNPVQNKVIKTAIDACVKTNNVQSSITNSTNPIQSKAVYNYINSTLQNKRILNKSVGQIEYKTTVAYTNSTLPYIDMSNIPHQADMHVEVGIIPDKNGGRVYFPFDFVNATLTPNYRYVSGYYYSSKWQGSVGIQISNNKLYLDTTWTRIYDDGSVLTCSTSGGTLNKVDAKIFVYTKYVEK